MRRRPDGRAVAGAVRDPGRGLVRAGLRGPGGAAWPDGLADLPCGPPRRARRLQATFLVRVAREVYRALIGRAAPGETLAPEARQRAAQAIRDLYRTIGRDDPNLRRKGIDWDEVGRELLPRVEVAETEEQFGLVAEEMAARLEDSSATVHWSGMFDRLPRWDIGFHCLIVDRGRPVSFDIGPGGRAWELGVRPGMAVVSVDGVPADVALERWMAEARKLRGYSSPRTLRSDAVLGFLRRQERGAAVALVLEASQAVGWTSP